MTVDLSSLFTNGQYSSPSGSTVQWDPTVDGGGYSMDNWGHEGNLKSIVTALAPKDSSVMEKVVNDAYYNQNPDNISRDEIQKLYMGQSGSYVPENEKGIYNYFNQQYGTGAQYTPNFVNDQPGTLNRETGKWTPPPVTTDPTQNANASTDATQQSTTDNSSMLSSLLSLFQGLQGNSSNSSTNSTSSTSTVTNPYANSSSTLNPYAIDGYTPAATNNSYNYGQQTGTYTAQNAGYNPYNAQNYGYNNTGYQTGNGFF